MAQTITVNKLNLAQEITWSYTGTVLERTPTYLRLEAYFNRPTSDEGYVTFEHNDRFVEHYFSDRWFNIFEVHSAQDDHLKGWYCNIVKPAVFRDNVLEQTDLALDVWIYPDGTYLILDEDEFTGLDLDAETRHRTGLAVNELIYMLYHRAEPFGSITRPRARTSQSEEDAPATSETSNAHA
jgi:protein associated with RNAse G/E